MRHMRRWQQLARDWGRRAPLAAALSLLAAASTACVDERVVFRDAPRFEQPTAQALNFVGYRDTATKATVCGSCHIGAQTQWAQTGHADAWRTLANSPARQQFCENCHAVTGLGNNATAANAGWATTRDLRYKDVQCEACHGPGLDHSTNPTTANRPLASIAADTGRRDGCAGCHNSGHHPFTSEWRLSGHGAMQYWSATGPNTRPECQSCHTGQGALAMYGVNARSSYREEVTGAITAANAQRITCAVCHDPHAGDIGRQTATQGGRAHSSQLRLPIDVPDENRNLCMTCHHKRAVPDLGTAGTATRGAHSPEGPLLLGDAGWWPPGMEVPGGLARIETTHGSRANPRLCAGCHIEKYQVTDSLTRQTIGVTGHRFLAIPWRAASWPSPTSASRRRAPGSRRCSPTRAPAPRSAPPTRASPSPRGRSSTRRSRTSPGPRPTTRSWSRRC